MVCDSIWFTVPLGNGKHGIGFTGWIQSHPGKLLVAEFHIFTIDPWYKNNTQPTLWKPQIDKPPTRPPLPFFLFIDDHLLVDLLMVILAGRADRKLGEASSPVVRKAELGPWGLESSRHGSMATKSCDYTVTILWLWLCHDYTVTILWLYCDYTATVESYSPSVKDVIAGD